MCFPPPIFAYFVLNACSHKKLFFLFKWIFRLWMEKRTVSTSVVIPLDFNLKKLRHWSCRKWKSGNKCMSVDWNYMTFNYLISEILFINLLLVFWQFSSVSRRGVNCRFGFTQSRVLVGKVGKPMKIIPTNARSSYIWVTFSVS